MSALSVPCPKCSVAPGEPCVRVSSIAQAEPRHGPAVLALQHPHRERLRAAGIPWR